MLFAIFTYKGVCDKIFEISLWDGIRFPEGKTSEDVGVVYKVVGQANGIAMYPYPMYYYFHRNGSITATNLATKNHHIVEFANDICTYVRRVYPSVLHEAEYFQLKCMLYWHRSFCLQPTKSGPEFDYYCILRKRLREQLMFALFECKYVGVKDKVWYLLILLGMKRIVRWLIKRKRR